MILEVFFFKIFSNKVGQFFIVVSDSPVFLVIKWTLFANFFMTLRFCRCSVLFLFLLPSVILVLTVPFPFLFHFLIIFMMLRFCLCQAEFSWCLQGDTALSFFKKLWGLESKFLESKNFHSEPDGVFFHMTCLFFLTCSVFLSVCFHLVTLFVCVCFCLINLFVSLK